MHAARIGKLFLAATVLAALAVQSPARINTRQARHPAESAPFPEAGGKLSHDYGNLPLAFEPNVGQTDARVRFLARGAGMAAFFTDTETIMVLSRSQATKPGRLGREEAGAGEVERAVVRMKLAGAGQPQRARGLEKLPGVSNYFIGNDPSKWRTDVPHYGRIQYEGVYPGIDLVWYGNQRRLEYDFVVAPGADPRQIQVAYEGVESVRLEGNGELVLRTALGEVRQQKPQVYQEIGGKRVEVPARYGILEGNRVTFELSRYDPKRELRIDPVVLVYSTYLGGSVVDQGSGIAVDAAGSAYVTGETWSTNFPTQSAYQATFQGGTGDAFVAKLTPAGNALVYSTYLGGSGIESGCGIAVDAAGSAYVTGFTSSTDFPTQSPYQGTFQGGRSSVPTDAFVAKLTPTGNALVYSTYLGGSGGNESGLGIAVDGAGSAYVTGFTWSTNFPTQSSYQGTLHGDQDAFVTKLTPAGNALVYSTYLGGSGNDAGSGIAVDAAGSAYVTGVTTSANFPTQAPYQGTYQGGGGDAFVTKLTPAGDALAYSTYLGGNVVDSGLGIAVDAAGSAYVTGYTWSTNFPTQSAYFGRGAFVTKLTPAGNALVYSTYLGGSGDDGGGAAIAVDAAGSAYVTGWTKSTSFPTQLPYQATFQGGDSDAFVTKLTPAGNALVYSTYLGGSGNESGLGIAVDAAGSAYVTGDTTSAYFPTQSPYQATFQGTSDAFVTKLALPTAQPRIGSLGTCSNATIAGAYGYAISGKLVSTGGGLVAFADSGSFVADGSGHLSGSSSTSVGAGIKRRQISGTYTISQDCTGSATLVDNLGDSISLGMVVVDDGRGIDFIETDPGAIISGSARVRGNHCTAATLTGGYGYALEGWGLGSTGYQVPFADAGALFSDGKGDFTGTTTSSSAGVIAKRAISGTYTVADDCTGGASFVDSLGQRMNLDIVVVDFGREVKFIQSDVGTVISGGAKQRSGYCSNPSVSGPYAYAIQGFVAAGNSFGAFADSGRLVADGNGNLSGTSTVSENGAISRRTLRGSYSVDQDCRGSAVLNASSGYSVVLDCVIVDNGRGIQFIQTDTGTVISGGARKQEAVNCTNGTVSGSYGFSIDGWLTATGFDAYADTGRLVVNGGNSFSGSTTSSLDGNVNSRTLTGNYNMNSDCTGSATFKDTNGNVLSLDFSAEAGGRELRFIQTDSGTVISGTGVRQFSLPWEAVVNAASFRPTGLVPGSLFTIFGTKLSNSEAYAATIPLPTTVGGAPVTISGKPVPLVYVNPGQINAQIPWEIPPGQAQLVVSVGGAASRPVDLRIVQASPGIFAYNVNRAVVINPDGTVNSQSSPAHAGQVLVGYLTGAGPVNASGPVATGAANPGGVSPVTLPFTVSVGGKEVHADYLGLAPYWVGLYQVNFTVPSLPTGDYPLVVTVGDQSSDGAMITIQ